jgi:nucleotide-binding universal stress UspA family protein
MEIHKMKDMLPIKRILWPTDFSDPADQALDVAAKLCSIFSAELVMLHVVSPIMVGPSPPPTPSAASGLRYPDLIGEMQAAAEDSFLRWRRNKVPKELNARHQVIIGNPAEQIVEIAQKESADIIVIATHGLTGWRRFIFGSVAEKVVRLAECPVLTIPAPTEEE